MYELPQVEVRLRLAEATPLYSTEQISTADKAVEIMARALSEMDREHVCVVNLDTQNRPINFSVVSIGSINQSLFSVSNIFKTAILCNANSIMLFHNHPSSAVKPSTEDINVTENLCNASHIMGIPVLDHIIVGGGSGERYSFRENYPNLFKKVR